jgi:hypothetical protein
MHEYWIDRSLNKPERSSTKVCVSILFFDAAKFDDNGFITGEGSKPAFNILRDLINDDYRPCGNNSCMCIYVIKKYCC